MPVSASSASGSVHLESGSHSTANRGRLSHPAVVLIAAGIVFWAAYALGYISRLDGLIDSAVRSSQGPRLLAFSPAIYGICGLSTFLLLLAFFRSFDLLLRRFRGPLPLASRPLKPLEEFVEETAVHQINPFVASEGYRLLEPNYPGLMCIGLADDLRSDLGLTEDDIRVLYAQLLLTCDRRDPSGAVAGAMSLKIVLDLLQRVETADRLPAERSSGTRERATDAASHRPAAPAASTQGLPDRNPGSAQRKAIHAAALQAIDSRSLRPIPASASTRRRSDYEGPRRRGTDHTPEPNHDGPFRRSTDRPVAKAGASSTEQEPEVLHNPQKTNYPERIVAPGANHRVLG